MVVYEKNFFEFSENFVSKVQQQNGLIDKYYKTIYEAVRTEYSSCMV